MTKRFAPHASPHPRLGALALITALFAIGCSPPTSETRLPQPSPHALDISLAHDTSEELATREQLLRLLAAHDLARWLFTRAVRIDAAATPHSHPVLTLHTRHLAHDDQLLSTFLHEQAHWYLDAHEEKLALAASELGQRFPELPVGFPEGARDLRSSREHLIVIWLELEALEQFVGEKRASAVFDFWEGSHYRSLYRLVRRERSTLRSLIERHGLFPEALRSTQR